MELLRPFTWDPVDVVLVRDDKTYYGARTSSFAHQAFMPFEELFYDNRDKRYTPELVERLTPRSLAYWFMDDGGASGRVLTLGCHTRREDLEIVKAGLHRTFGVDLRIDRYYDGFYRIVASTMASRAWMVQEIGPHLHPSMRYKIPTRLIR